MGARSGLNYTNVTEDQCLCNEPTLLYGFVAVGRDIGWNFKIYDGRDATSGRLVCWIKGAEDISNPIMFPKPIMLPLGLYVDDIGDMEDLLVIWERAPKSARYEKGVLQALGP